MSDLRNKRSKYLSVVAGVPLNIILSKRHHMNKEPFKILKKSNWFIRPAYSFRFKLPKMKNPFSWIPGLDEVFCNGMLILLERPKT